MEKELDPDVIKATQTSLGKYVKRPPLNEKLLKKPPFRFLHDIVTSVLKTTGFFEGLFEEEELISDNVKERENKIQFLNKVIYVVGATTGKTLSVKPSKIVAGQEAEKTNDLLQCLAQALDKKLSSDEAVKKYKGEKKSTQVNEKKPKETLKVNKKTNDTKKITSKSTEKVTSNKKEPTIKVTNKNENDKSSSSKNQKENTTIKNESLSKKRSQTKVLTKKPSLEKSTNLEEDKQLPREIKNKLGNDIIAKNMPINNETFEDLNTDIIETDRNTTEQEHQESVTINNDQQDVDSFQAIDNKLNSSLSSQELMEIEKDKVDENISLINQNQIEVELIEDHKSTDLNKINDGNEFEQKPDENYPNKQLSRNNSNDMKSHETTSTVEKSINQASFKGSPVKIGNLARPLSMRPSSSRPGAPRLRDKHENITSEPENLIVGKVNIIAENTPIEEEEDANVVIVEHEVIVSSNAEDDQEPVNLSSDQHGHLVQQILESQKEYSQISGKTEIEWHFGAQKAREAVNREIEQLRYNVQALSRVTNPLGKILDHVQEDVEVMRQELQQWTKTYEETSKQLSKQKLSNEESLLPLHTKVKQLDFDIQEKNDKINDLKVVIHKNSVRIEKLLASGSVQ
ncbi:TRAF3-interacting protein 1 isoform X2 [Achroia grisella]|nr:TRAF3-interacting protein 1 isoform X2 [Achroia grisella]